MMTSSSEIVVIPKRFSGIRVLLIEPDESSLVQHAYMLSQNSYRVMVSDDIHMMRFVTEALKNEAILCLVKPCDLSDICNIWTHVCRKRIASEKHDSKGKLPHANNIIKRVDPMFKPFATFNRAMNNNEISHDYGAMSKPVYMNFGNDVGTSSTTRNTNKGKQPIDNGQLLQDVTYQKKRKNNKPRINWTEALHGKFLEALNTLGKQKAYPSEILKHMNVPGLTRNHVASHLQKLEKVNKRPRLVPVVQMGDNLQAGNDASKRSRQLILSDHNHGSVIQSSSLQGPLSLDNIKARSQESALLVPVPHATTTTVSNSGNDLVTDHSSCDTFRFPNEIQMKGYGYEPLAQFDCFGIPIDP
ncbi:hypothetical protein L6452_13372 [Arctium lappa]|uniref:Uncharacterized protein n=1 Tax=Arctium lappa TaxID=4217 RepID=A0ACB9CI10_ARCLA|nr:hypothetical protein L6452_13372 [Arctium lappa]